jgi:monofunctional chorismate mutase
MHLTEIRQKISTIDTELLRLLDERMELVVEVAKYKKKHNLPIYDPAREAEVLRNIPVEYHTLWQELMDVSKHVQEEYLNN